LQKLRDENGVQPGLLPMRHFESALFHSLSPYDAVLRLKRDDVLSLLSEMFANREEIALTKPTKNDQLFRLFGEAKEEKKKGTRA